MKTSKWVLATFCLCIMGSSLRADITYDPATSVSTNSNPNGVWTYGYTTNLGGTLIPFVEPGDYFGLTFWRTNILHLAPTIYYNPTDAAITPSSLRVNAKQLVFHPGPYGELAVIRFTVPVTAQYQLSASFVGADLGGTTTDVHVLTNGVAVFNGIVTGYGPGTGPGYSNTFSLNAGETLDFVVGRGFNDFGHDTTGIAAQIVRVTTAPTLTCPEAANLECETTAQIGVTVGSPSGASVDVVWTVNGTAMQTNSVPAAAGPASPVLVTVLPIGTNIVGAVATDSYGKVTACSSSIVVRDTTAPTIFSASAQPSILWPANHKMVEVRFSILVGDNCGATTWKIINVSCSEPTKPKDWIVTGDQTVQLRAEQSKGNVRTYFITVEANDGHGNTSSRVLNVVVPISGK